MPTDDTPVLCHNCEVACRQAFGHMVTFRGEKMDVLTLAGASPDALVVVQADDTCERWIAVAVIEAKCRCPFHYQFIGTGPVPSDCAMHSNTCAVVVA